MTPLKQSPEGASSFDPVIDRFRVDFKPGEAIPKYFEGNPVADYSILDESSHLKAVQLELCISKRKYCLMCIKLWCQENPRR